MKKILKGLLVAMVLVGGAYASMSSGVAGQEKVRIGESEGDKTALMRIARFLNEKGRTFTPYVQKDPAEGLFHKNFAEGAGEAYSRKFGNLQNNVQSLGIPSGTINRNIEWSTLLFRTYEYIRGARDKYEYFYRLYQIASLRFAPDDSSQPSASVPLVVEKDTDIDAVFQIGNKSAVRKAFFNWILFAGTMLDPMADDSFAKEYFAEEGISQEWERMRQLIEIVKKENGGK